MAIRPSAREINNRIKEAKSSLVDHDVWFVDPNKAVGEISALGIGDTAELKPLMMELLNEISLVDYSGGLPPQRSYERAIANCELWAFSWNSIKLGQKMYLKFALKKGRFFLVSIHKDRPPK